VKLRWCQTVLHSPNHLKRCLSEAFDKADVAVLALLAVLKITLQEVRGLSSDAAFSQERDKSLITTRGQVLYGV
jgi:hypothetical protein